MAAARAARPFDPHYAPQWTALVAFLLTLGAYCWFNQRAQFPRTPVQRTVAAPGANWFMILRMPEIPSEQVNVEFLQNRIAKHLEALQRQGFHPILLSDVHRHLTRGSGLPSKAVILLFDPGNRYTFDALQPILKRYKWPAVWLTPAAAIKAGDRRYISAHAAGLMAKSNLWDVGVYTPGKDLVIQNQQEGVWTFPHEGPSFWSPLAGTSGYNSANHARTLNRLNVNPNWTTDEFIDRVLTEVPTTEPARLGGRYIGEHLWGITLPMQSKEPATFSVKAPLDARGASIAWLGTRQSPDAQLDLHATDFSGEVWLLLRSEDELGNNLRIGFAEGHVMVEEESNHVRRRLASAPVDNLGQPGSPLSARIWLQGHRLSVTVAGHPVLYLQNLSTSDSDAGLVRLAVYDKLRGNARADNVSLTLTPLHEGS